MHPAVLPSSCICWSKIPPGRFPAVLTSSYTPPARFRRSAPIKLYMLVEDFPWQISRGAHIKLHAPLADFTAVLKIKLHTPLEDFPAVLDVCLRLERLVKQNAPL